MYDLAALAIAAACSRLLWDVESFDRIVAPATPDGHGFTTKDLTWLLEHAPEETLVLKPREEAAVSSAGRGRSSGSPAARTAAGA
jgi:hypothetical protein